MDIKLRLWPLLLWSSWAGAQGRFMAPLSVAGSTSAISVPLLIGQRTPETLVVQDQNGARRPLLSYKSPIEVMAVFFLSGACAQSSAAWSDFRHFYARFKGWHVAFMAVSTQEGERAEEIAALLKKENLARVAVVRDEEQATLKLFKPSGFPWLVILDEDGRLRYRGPLRPAQSYPAMDAIIGHIDPVKNPEPDGKPECAMP